MNYGTRNTGLKKPELSDSALISDINDNIDIIDGIIAKCNFIAVTNPSIYDDIGDGYSPGSIWFNLSTSTIFKCISNTFNNALWQKLGDVTGPSSSIVNRIVGFSDTTGKLVKDLGYTIDELLLLAGRVNGQHIVGSTILDKVQQGSIANFQHFPNIFSRVSNVDVINTGAWIIHSPISRTSAELFIIRVHGYFYSLSTSIDFTIVGYTYAKANGNVDGQPGAVFNYSLRDNGNDGLPKYVGIDSSGKVAIAIGTTATDVYYGRLSVDLYTTKNIPTIDIHTGWSIDISTTAGFGWGDIHGPLQNNYKCYDLYAENNISALSFTDRTPFYEGDALKEIAKIKGKDGTIDHTTLPEFAKVIKRKNKDNIIEESDTTERNLGNMLSILTVALQQQIKINEEQTLKNIDIETRLSKLEKK